MYPVRLPTLASLPPPRPDPAQDRFQTDAVFVQRSALARRLRLCVLDVLGSRGEGVGKAA
jgi:hypothetical protein